MEIAASYTNPHKNSRFINPNSWFQYVGTQPNPDLPAHGVTITLFHCEEGTFITQEFIEHGLTVAEYDSYLAK